MLNLNARKVLFYGDNAVYRHGGAERSAFVLLSSLADVEIGIISGIQSDLEQQLKKYPYDQVSTFEFYNHPYFKYLSFTINYWRAKKVINNCAGDILFSQRTAPIAINHFNGPSVYFLRSENDLNVYRTYRTGLLRKFTFMIKFLLEWPFFIYFCVKNRQAIKEAKLLVANSEFLAAAVKRKFNKDSVVFYPPIDIKSITDGQNSLLLNEKKYIMMVGSEKVKGVEIFLKIAQMMPNYEFLLIGKSCKNEKVGNVTYHPFVQDPLPLYREAKLLLVPSIWEEAFGRVSVESQAVGTPVIVSSRGGLPETVPSMDYVVNDIYDGQSWVRKINEILHNYEYHSKISIEYVQKFDIHLGIKQLLEAIYSNTGVKLYARNAKCDAYDSKQN